MKKLLTFCFFTLSFSLLGQSNLIKIGVNHRNTDYLPDNPSLQSIGFQVGYNYKIYENLLVEVNVGRVANYWDNRRQNALIYTETEQTTYIEGIILFPILRRWVPSGRLKGGIEYIRSQNSFEYVDSSEVFGKYLRSATIFSLAYYLNEFGVVLDYTHPLSNHFVIYASSGFSLSTNLSPRYNSSIKMQNTGGASWSDLTVAETNRAHYRVSMGIGYMF